MAYGRIALVLCFSKSKLNPLQQAHAELEAMHLQTDSVCFADGLIRCLRRYLKNEYSIGLDSYSQTELRSAILKQLDLENQVEVDLAALFEQCEQVKFSQLSLDSHSRDTLQKQAKALLRQLEPSTQDPKNERFSIRSSRFFTSAITPSIIGLVYG